MKAKHKRLSLVLAFMLVAAGGVGLILYSFSQHLIYFYTPTLLKSEKIAEGATIRLGGLVKVDSIEKTGNQSIRFVITDLTHEIVARYTGTLPALFREGQGVVAEGMLDAKGQLMARTILAKHDENYMPQEVVDALKSSGRWQHYSDENVRTFKPKAEPAP